jgi:hypothetical protein
MMEQWKVARESKIEKEK